MKTISLFANPPWKSKTLKPIGRSLQLKTASTLSWNMFAESLLATSRFKPKTSLSKLLFPELGSPMQMRFGACFLKAL